MSGGHITGYHSLPSIAEEIERLAIEQPELGPDVLGRYRLAAEHARRAYEAIRAVDYLESGDYGRESFVQTWDALVVDPASALRAEVQRLHLERDAAIDERNAWRSGDQDSRIEADRLRGEVQRLTEEARRSDAGRVEVLIPDPPESEMPHVSKSLHSSEGDFQRYRGFEDGIEWARKNARLSPSPQPATVAAQSLDDETVMYHAMSRWIERTPSCPSPMEGYIAGWQDRPFSPQPSADVVVVPREEWRELRAFARISGYPEGRFSFEVPFEKDFAAWGSDIAHRLGITRDEEQLWLDACSSTNHDSKEAP